MLDVIFSVLPERVDWAIPCYWLAMVGLAGLGAWLIEKQGPTPRI